MRRRAWIAVVLGVLLLTVPAGAQTVPLSGADDAVEGTVDTVASTTTDVGDAVQGTVDNVASTTTNVEDPLEDTVDAVEETVDTTESTAGQTVGAVQDAAGDATGSAGTSAVPTLGGTSSGAGGSTAAGGSSSSGSTTSSGTSGNRSAKSRSGGGGEAGSRATRHRTRFDRLPRRFETLLERIEFGRNVRANLRRLEELFASASPALRARILRLVQAEILRLRRNGVTAAERSRIERLQLVKRALRGNEPAAARASSPSPAPFQTWAAQAGTTGRTVPLAAPASTGEGGVLGERAADGGAGAQTGGGDQGASAGPLPLLPQIPDGPDEFPFAIGLILLVLAGLGLTGVVARLTARLLGRTRSS